MPYYTFNIGQPHIDPWWLRNRKLGIITAGFSGEAGDRGDVILHQMNEGDWVIAYSNGHGFVGAGRVGPGDTYQLMSENELPPDWETTHRHRRQVDWVYAVDTLTQAIPANDVDRQAPRQTKELLPEHVGLQLLQLLRMRSQTAISTETISTFTRAFTNQVEESLRLGSEGRRERLRLAPKKPERVQVIAYEFLRNPDVVAEVLCRAKGICESCSKPAPFNRRRDGSPYLEVHHKIQLSFGGEDSVENAIALCPNCHRKSHYGAEAN